MLLTIKCKILIIQNAQYSHIIVDDLNRNADDELKYVDVVLLPNWEPQEIQVGDVGFLQFESVTGGETKYKNRNTNEDCIYAYSNNYFIRFTKEIEKCEQEKYKF